MPDSNHRRCEQCPARPHSRRLWTLLARLSHAHAVIPPSTPAGRRGSRALRGSARKQDTVRDLLCLRLWLREKENTGVSHLLRSTLGGAEVTRRRLHHPADGRCWCMTAYSWCFSSLFGRDFILLIKVQYLYIGRVWVKVLSYIASLGRGFPHSQRMKDNKCFACW